MSVAVPLWPAISFTDRLSLKEKTKQKNNSAGMIQSVRVSHLWWGWKSSTSPYFTPRPLRSPILLWALFNWWFVDRPFVLHTAFKWNQQMPTFNTESRPLAPRPSYKVLCHVLSISCLILNSVLLLFASWHVRSVGFLWFLLWFPFVPCLVFVLSIFFCWSLPFWFWLIVSPLQTSPL